MEKENNQELGECCNGQCNGSCKGVIIPKRTWKDWLGFIVVFSAMFALIVWLTNKDPQQPTNNIKEHKKENISPPVFFKDNNNV